MKPSTWFLFRSGACEPAFNMAADELLLSAVALWQKPVLRFYSWTEPAATFGYFQKYSEVAGTTMLRPLIRRPTGGGMVPHDADWTYSLAFPTTHEWYALKAVESYRRVHEWIRDAFTKLNVTTELAPCCKKSVPGQCFVGHEQFDVLWHGKKIAGAAQRRTKEGLLIQGSVQPPPISLQRADWENAMCRVAEAQDTQWSEFNPDAALNTQITELVRTKYAQAEFNQKR